MAAGRIVGYVDDEFRDTGSDFDMSKKELGYANGDYDPRRKGKEYGKGRGWVRDSLGYRDRVRQKDAKERELMKNGGYLSNSSRRDLGNNGGGFAVRTMDREPGELSSDGSDEDIDSEAAVNNKETEFKKLEKGNHLSPVQNTKRKFSPIVWDRDGREARKIIKSRHISETVDLTPPPLLVKSYLQSPNSNPDFGASVQSLLSDDSEARLSNPDADAQSLLSNDSEVRVSDALPSKSVLPPVLPENPSDISSLPSDEPLVNNLGTRAVDDDEYMPTRTITSSRWANDAGSPADEGEISDYEDIKFLKRKSGSGSAQARDRKSISPEVGEVREQSSDRARSSESDGRARSSSRVSDLDNDDRNDYMELDDGRNHDVSSVSRSDTESNDDYVSLDTPQPIRPLQRSVNMLRGCRSVDEFERLNKIDEGTYGVVFRARDKRTGEIVALKKVKMEKEREGFPLTALREINILLSFHHPSIVDVKEVVVGNSLDCIFMAMEYMEHDLKALMETIKQPFSQSEVKCLMLQLLSGIKYLHDNWVLHRDLKTSNLLLNNRGELKICDFGLARQYGSPLKPYTQLVVTLWYRAPELLLGGKQYSTAIDMWSLGCIMAELLSKEPLFNGKSELDQLDKIFKVLGTPNETIWPGCTKLPLYKVNFVKHRYNLLRKKFPATSFTGSPVLSDAGFDLLNKLLTYDPEQRITAEAALNHEWFREVPLPKSKEFMPTFPAQHAQDRRTRRVFKSPDPLEDQRRKELQQGELGTLGGLFGQ